jgi:hypothetical protein
MEKICNFHECNAEKMFRLYFLHCSCKFSHVYYKAIFLGEWSPFLFVKKRKDLVNRSFFLSTAKLRLMIIRINFPKVTYFLKSFTKIIVTTLPPSSF